ncbi:MAG: magnesium transporter [Candidatus Omnitrophota bacterium]
MSALFQDKNLTFEEIKETWHALSTEERIEAFLLLDRKTAKDFFLTLSPEEMATILLNIPQEERELWLRLLPLDDVTDVVQSVDKEDQHHLLNLLDPKALREVIALLSYNEDVAGGLMDPHFVRVRPDLTADEAIRYLRLQAKEYNSNRYYVYVLNARQQLMGVLSLHDLFRAAPDTRIQDIMKSDVIFVNEQDDQEEIGRLFSHHKLVALPVVDEERHVKGIITLDDVLHAVQDEATEDIQKIGGVESFDSPYLQLGFWEMLKKRAGWLVILFFGAMFTASAMSSFQDEISRAIVLAIFVPLIISSGGNSGSQASTIVIRAMALGEVRLRDWFRIIRREAATGATLGCILGVLGLGRILFGHYVMNAYGEHYLLIGYSIAVSLVGVVLWGTVCGSMLPFILRRFNLDPASASAPLVATLVDLSGIIIYFSINRLILTGTVL